MNFWSTLPQPIIGLSPMDGVTDAAFRSTVARLGAPDVCFTEFTSVGDICRGPDFLLSSLLYHEWERPVVAQLYGKDPDLFYAAAHVVAELGFDGLDINMGCPSRNVASSGSGAALIRTPQLAHAIIRAARQGLVDWSNGRTLASIGLKPSRIALIEAMNRRCGRADPPRRLLPLSVKTRLGYETVVIEQWVGHLLEEAPAAICIHGRTLEQMYRGEADWKAIERTAPLFSGTPTLLLGNGDIGSLQEAVRRAGESRVHGVLVGRATLGRPWFFRRKEAARRLFDPGAEFSEDVLPEETPDLPERFRIMLGHAHRFESLFGVERFPRMRKHLGWYCKGFAHAAAMRASMVRASSGRDVEHILSAYRVSSTEASREGCASDRIDSTPSCI